MRLPVVTITIQTLAGGAMQLNQIRYFLALYEERNFTRAARRCGVSQPSLTNAIKRLEQTFGSPLFERTSRNTEPTQLGQVAADPLGWGMSPGAIFSALARFGSA